MRLLFYERWLDGPTWTRRIVESNLKLLIHYYFLFAATIVVDMIKADIVLYYILLNPRSGVGSEQLPQGETYLSQSDCTVEGCHTWI